MPDRILVYGVTGSGKTVLANRISIATGIAWHTIVSAVDGRQLCNGNRESFRHIFSRDSIILWHFRSFSRKHRRIREWEADPTFPQVVRLTSPRQADNWLARQKH